jgi:gliding motility-associated-like protein
VYVQPAEATTFTVQIANICGIGVDSVMVSFVSPEVSAAGGGWMCRGESMILEASEGTVYSWQPAALCGNPSGQTTTVFPVESTTFTVFVTDAFGCTASSTLEVGVWQPPYVDAGPDRELDWLDEARLFGTADSDSAWWTPAELLSCSVCESPVLLSSEPGWYVLSAISEEGCVGRDSAFVDLYYPIYVPNAFTPNNDGVNDAFFVEGVEPRGYLLEVFNRWGERVFQSTDAAEVWQGNWQRGSGEHYVPDGVYLWRVRYELRDGPRWAEGHVTVIR